MKIIIKTLTLVNFKGIKNFSLSMSELITNVFGDNATGKTTISDAFHWLFFGKESTDRKDFNIKNMVDTSLNRQNHEVSALINIDGFDVAVKRIFREKWTKKRGAEEAEFTGNETLYYWDDIPVNQTEFTAKISNIIDEKIFRLISNPSYFNALKWPDRRQILFDISGGVSYDEVAAENEKFKALLNNLTNGKTLEEYKKQVVLSRRRIKQELEEIPTRIDEVSKSIPEMGDASLIKRAMAIKKAKINLLDEQMAERSKSMNKSYESIREFQKRVFVLESDLDRISNSLKAREESLEQIRINERAQIDRELKAKQWELQQIEAQFNRRRIEIETIAGQIVSKRTEWNSLNAEKGKLSADSLVFDENEFVCPTCSRQFEEDNIASKKEQMLLSFNSHRATAIQNIVTRMTNCVDQANAWKVEIDRLESLDNSKDIAQLTFDMEALQCKLDNKDVSNVVGLETIEAQLAKDDVYQEVLANLALLKKEEPVEPKVDLTDLQNEKLQLEEEIREFERELAKEPIIANAKERIMLLASTEKSLAAEMAQLEGTEFTINAFNRKKIEIVENRINGLFSLVKFKMYDLQINGSEVETCETMFEGVPYSDLNNAARINAGLDIINALCKWYAVNAPIFVDNAESVVRLIRVDSQIIRLVVSEIDKELRVA